MSNARNLIILAALAAVIGGAWYLSAPSNPKSGAADAKPAPVTTALARVVAAPQRIDAAGNVQARAVVPIRPRIEGEVIGVHFQEGAEIAEGDLLYTLDSRQAEAARRQAEAALARDVAMLERARADLDRYRELTKAGSATRQKLEQAAADHAQLEAQVKADRAALDAAKLSVDYSRITAPVSGRTGASAAKLGSLAKPGDSQVMTTITVLRPIDASFAVAERHLPAIRAAMNAGASVVEVRVDGSAEPVARGKLTFMDSSVDRSTGTIALKAEFDNAKSELWPGQFITASLILDSESRVLAAPAEAVQYGQAGAYVYKVDDQSRAHVAPVVVARIQDGMAVIAQGLNDGDKVVVQGQMRLSPGAAVIERDDKKIDGQKHDGQIRK